MPEFVTSWCQPNATSNSSGWHSFKYGILTGPVLAKRKKEKSGSFSYITTPCWWILGTVFANLSASDWKTRIQPSTKVFSFVTLSARSLERGLRVLMDTTAPHINRSFTIDFIVINDKASFFVPLYRLLFSTSTSIAAPARCCWDRVNERGHRSKYSPGLNQPKTPKELDCRNDTA